VVSLLQLSFLLDRYAGFRVRGRRQQRDGERNAPEWSLRVTYQGAF